MPLKPAIKEQSVDYLGKGLVSTRQTRVYHVAYEPTLESVSLHFWTNCNLHCRGCLCRYEKLYWNLYEDPESELANKAPVAPPSNYLSKDEVIELLRPLKIKTILFMGVEPSLDPELPALAQALHEEFHSCNILMTNGVKLTDLEHIDSVLFSLKALSEDVHVQYTGKSNKKILRSFTAIHDSGTKLSAISLVIPGLIEAQEIEKIAMFIESIDRNISFMVHAYFAMPNAPWRTANSEEVEAAVKLARKHLANVPYRTLDLKRVGEPAIQIY